MSVVLWTFGLLAAVAAALAASPKLRKLVFLWGTYATLTGWYYYRVLEKKHKSPTAGEAKARAAARAGKAQSTSSLSSTSSSSSRRAEDDDVVYFETPEEIQRRLERASEASSRASEASASELSAAADDALGGTRKAPKTHLGIFRRAASEDKRRTVSEADTRASEVLAASASSRRTYTGRHKKPANWGE